MKGGPDADLDDASVHEAASKLFDLPWEDKSFQEAVLRVTKAIPYMSRI